ncbi:hypothetical protein CLV91_2453 [Maribacter vaceletii]|uniref:Winged helix DNA-binding protein n=1 Tax=Maribacter vaceletii TaxID=1206816 RepID=A0A495E943_9FLAO|nr:crosslink repair DNA glycosylase YcaQ family protein [Maribacter vaceletii]RKR12327.1 hypothetical protein CLV91_2453 [Maribacter vaceletii]
MTKKVEILSSKEAQKIILLSQKVLTAKITGSALSATLNTIEHLGYIQIDTISVVQRAHHHTLWTRNPRYQTTHLSELIKEKKVFEYWSHAAAYLPIKEYRYSLPRKNDLVLGTQKHWYNPNKKLMQQVLERITKEGPLMAKDFENTGKMKGDWTTKPTKQALEYLFMQGELMISSRKNFHKVYDITERVIPENTNTSLPSPEEHARFLIKKYLNANGLAQSNEIAYLLKNIKPNISKALEEMLLSNEVLKCNVNNKIYYILPETINLLNKPLYRSKLKILSPFDNLLIQRKRMQDLFNFDYLIECYVPEAKRKYGYFSLPILWDGKFAARMDCKAYRKDKILHVNNLVLEPSLKKIDEFSKTLTKELKKFKDFNNCDSIKINRTNPTNSKQLIEEQLNNNG